MTQPVDSDTLRASLLRVADDRVALSALCLAQRDAIRKHFASWVRVPEPLKSRPDLLNTYVQSLVAIATVFAEQLGDSSLSRHLSPAGDNPIERWDASLSRARDHMAAMRLGDAIAGLTDLAIDVGRLTGTATDAYLPAIFGSLGECYFQSGQTERALDATRQALTRVLKKEDVEGIVAYLGNLYEIHRYRGEAADAADYAERLAAVYEAQGNAAEATRYRKQSALVRAGEPALRVVVDLGGRRYELDELLAGIEGTVRFLFERNRLALAPSRALTQQAQQQASRGKYAEALALFEDAIAADPLNPQPVYESGLTYVHLGRPADAVACYDRTEELAPGWFHCRSEGWLARQIVAERYPLEVFVTLHTVQEGPLEPAIKMSLVAQTLKQYPDLAIMHHLHGKLLTDAQQQASAVAAFRWGLACAEEPDVRTRLLVDLASAVESDDERNELCRQARALNGNLVASATAAVVLAFG